jgi:hypothetical protein
VRSSHNPDAITVCFDDDHAVADAGLILAATLAEGLMLRELLDEHVDLGGAPAAANAGDKAMTLIHSALAGGAWIEDADRLRAGSTGQVLGHRVAAPSTLGTFLRSFTWGSARQLDHVAGKALARAWQAGAGPRPWPLTIDIDSTHCQTYGLAKQGATAIDRHGERGYHPLLASVAGTGDVLHSRRREGTANSGRGAGSFVAEAITRARRAGGDRADLPAGRLGLLQPQGRPGVPQGRRELLDHGQGHQGGARRDRRHPQGRLDADRLLAGRRRRRRRDQLPAVWPQGPGHTLERPPGAAHPRLAARPVLRLRLPPVHHRPLRQHLELEADHRRHAEVENTIRDLKYGVGLAHLPSGRFAANAAWLTLSVIAYNQARWTSRLGLGETQITTKTLRTRYLDLPGRLTRSARRLHLHLPTHWPRARRFLLALDRLRCVPFPT